APLAAPRRERVAGWRRGRRQPPPGHLPGTQHQALLREAAPAPAKYDEDQKKAEEARKKADEEKAKAEAAAKAAPPPAPPPMNQPNVASIAPKPGAATGTDGTWRGTYRCTPSRGGGEFTMAVNITVQGGVGT